MFQKAVRMMATTRTTIKEAFLNINVMSQFSFDFGVDKNFLDKIFKARCGDRYVSPIVEEFVTVGNPTSAEVKNLCDAIEVYYKNKWIKTQKALGLTYDVLSPLETTVQSNSDVTNTQNNKVYGFDSDTGVDDTSNSATSKNEKTETRKSRGARTPQSLILEELNITKYTFIDIVFKDIIDLIALDIY